MDALDLSTNKDLRSYFEGLNVDCPSGPCPGKLSDYVQENWQPFKAFLYCPICESRLRVHQIDKGWAKKPIIIP